MYKYSRNSYQLKNSKSVIRSLFCRIIDCVWFNIFFSLQCEKCRSFNSILMHPMVPRHEFNWHEVESFIFELVTKFSEHCRKKATHVSNTYYMLTFLTLPVVGTSYVKHPYEIRRRLPHLTSPRLPVEFNSHCEWWVVSWMYLYNMYNQSTGIN